VSCKSLITNYLIGKADIYKDLKVLENHKGQTIVFFPMVHVGKESYYKDCKTIIDSLRNDGFKIFYENIAFKDELDSLTELEYNKKVRAILGFNSSMNSDNESLPKIYSKKNYILQDYALMGISQNDTNLDLDKKAIIDSIEKKYGKIQLTECDINTSLDDEYDCNSDYDKYAFEFKNKFRDSYISNEVLKLKEDKIVLIYGKMHWYFVYPDLIKNGFKLTQGKV